MKKVGVACYSGIYRGFAVRAYDDSKRGDNAMIYYMSAVSFGLHLVEIYSI